MRGVTNWLLAAGAACLAAGSSVAQSGPLLPPLAEPMSGGPVVVSGPGCVNCGGAPTAAPAAGGASAFQTVAARLLIGEGCRNPVECGNFYSERTFAFGSCRQFYHPGNNCGGHGRWRPDFSMIYGPGGMSDPPCTYFSYGNR